MLKFLTHKLRTHSINEENSNQKGDEDHDSGTESDEEIKPMDLSSSVTSDRMSSISPADTGCSMESPAPDPQDPHSSEEELEVINSNPKLERIAPPLRAASVCLPEKRKWSQVTDNHYKVYGPGNEENMSHFSNVNSSFWKSRSEEAPTIEHSGSSDDEVHNQSKIRATPVKFRTSPPLEAVKPGGRRIPINKGRSISPPPKLLHYEMSPRKRSKHIRHAHSQRPYLDFEKMQQLKARSSATAWRPSDAGAGELSVYCW